MHPLTAECGGGERPSSEGVNAEGCADRSKGVTLGKPAVGLGQPPSGAVPVACTRPAARAPVSRAVNIEARK